MVVYDYKKLWLAVGTVAICEFDGGGEFVDPADAAKVEVVRGSLPADLKDEYAEASTAEVLGALIELRKVCNQPSRGGAPGGKRAVRAVAICSRDNPSAG